MLIPDRKKRGFPDIQGVIHRHAEEIIASAHFRLERHFMFESLLKSLNISYESGTLRVTGQLPSFYHKQVLQTVLQDLPGVNQVENRVEVVSFSMNGATSPNEN